MDKVYYDEVLKKIRFKSATKQVEREKDIKYVFPLKIKRNKEISGKRSKLFRLENKKGTRSIKKEFDISVKEIYRSFDLTLDEKSSFSGKIRRSASKSPSFNRKGVEISNICEKINKGQYKDALIMINNNSYFKTDDLVYYEGVCHKKLKDFKRAREIFENLVYTKGCISPDIIVLLIETLDELSEKEELFKVLNLAMKKYPNDLVISKTISCSLFKLKKYKDMRKLLKKISDDESRYLIIESFRKEKRYNKSLLYINDLSSDHELFFISSGKLNYSLADYDKGIENFRKINRSSKYFIEGLYYFGKCYFNKGLNENAELSFEEVAIASNRTSTRALYKLTQLKLKNNDYYGAFHAFSRIKLEIVTKNKNRIKDFTQCAYYVLQNHIKKAIDGLNSLIKHEDSVDYLYKYFILRAFCYFSLEKYELSEEDYRSAGDLKPLDKSSSVNILLAKVSYLFFEGNFNEVIKISKSSQESVPMLVLLYVYSKIYLFPSNELRNSKKIFKLIDKITRLKRDTEVYQLKSFLYFCIQDFSKSLKLIKKSHFSIRQKHELSEIIEAFIYISQSNYQEAYQIISKIEFDTESKFILFSYRSVCAIFLDHESECLSDIKEICKIDSYKAKVLSIYLYLVANKLNDALLLISQTEKTTEMLLIEAHCLLLKFDLEKSKIILKKIKTKNCENDIFIISNLISGRLLSNGTGLIFNEFHVLWIEGVQKFYEKDYSGAYRIFESLSQNLTKAQSGQFFAFCPIFEQEFSLICYNLVISALLKNTKNSLSSALNFLKVIRNIKKDSLSEQILLYFLYEKIENLKKSEKILTSIKVLSEETFKNIQNSSDIFVYPQYAEQKFYDILPFIKVEALGNIYTKPTFSIPLIYPPMDFEDSCDLIRRIFKLYSPKPRPEVPWLEKVGINYRFTSRIISDI